MSKPRRTTWAQRRGAAIRDAATKAITDREADDDCVAEATAELERPEISAEALASEVASISTFGELVQIRDLIRAMVDRDEAIARGERDRVPTLHNRETY